MIEINIYEKRWALKEFTVFFIVGIINEKVTYSLPSVYLLSLVKLSFD